MIAITFEPIVVSTTGPSTGKRNTYRVVIMPTSRHNDEKETTIILRFKYKKDTPIATPNKPVVKGKIMSSLG